MRRRDFLRGAGAGIAAVSLDLTHSLPVGATATTSTSTLGANLEDATGQWGIYIDPPTRRSGYLLNGATNPSRDGLALRLGITGGDPYTGVQAAYRLAPADAAVAFELSMWWRFSATTFNNEGAPSRVQAVELCMNKWSRDMGRYEWGMQWANVSDGSPEAGVVPTWRLWTGTGWKNVGPTQRLTPDTWHYFLLQGDIVQGQVRYVRFVSDSAAQTLGHRFAPQRVAGGGEPVVAFQIDGNFRQEPYDCFFDAVSLQGFPTSPWSGG